MFTFNLKGGFKMTYEARIELKPKELKGFSESQITQHWKLYEGYVAQTNSLKEELLNLRKEGKVGTPLYADRRRRFGFELNGMVLHEYYFGNLASGHPGLAAGSHLYKALESEYGNFDAWKEDFVKAGASRSIGWAALYLDPRTGSLTNHFIQLHEEGHIAGFIPVLLMDVWEHAYMVDFGAAGRPDYIKMFFDNVNWDAAEKRFLDAKDTKLAPRF
jgi:superoxide dismutase, Fe-Mn family